MLNRVTPPLFQEIKPFKIKEALRLSLDNGRNVYYLNHGVQPIFKLEISLKAGSWYAERYELVSLGLKSLNESTNKRSSSQMANAIDSLGAFIEFNTGFDFSSISIYGLTKHFQKITRIIEEILKEPKFDETEFEVLRNKEQQRIELNEEKNSYLSSVELRKCIFSNDHPYGKHPTVNGIKSISITQLRNFFKMNFDDYEIFISGQLPDSFDTQLNESFGLESIKKVSKKKIVAPEAFDKGSNIVKPNSIQTSISIGKLLFKRDHPDYIKFLVTNELLGGFFGSRLMKNIREEKGLTYGIYSHIYSLRNEGYFSISTDIKGEFADQAIDEIFKEIQILQSIPVDFIELETVKNYMLGSFTSSTSTPFALMDRFKAVYFQGLDYDYYEKYFKTLSEIKPEDLLHQSQKHLRINFSVRNGKRWTPCYSHHKILSPELLRLRILA